VSRRPRTILSLRSAPRCQIQDTSSKTPGNRKCIVEMCSFRAGKWDCAQHPALCADHSNGG